MQNKFNRREFLEQASMGTLGAATSLSGIDNIIDQFAVGQTSEAGQSKGVNNAMSAGSVINLPEGGGAVQGIGEKFQANPFTGTANFSVPIYTSSGRSGFGPELGLQYSSGSGNGIFGQGWGFSVPKVTRKTDKGLPSYEDFIAEGEQRRLSNKDVFVLSGAEDLVPYSELRDGKWKVRRSEKPFEIKYSDGTKKYDIYYFRPRVEGLFARIEWWVETKEEAQPKSFWKITTKENISSYYGFRESTKLSHPNAKHKVFEWCLDMTCDAKGNYIIYDYKADTAEDVLAEAKIHEAHRNLRPKGYVYQRFLKRIYYGSDGKFSTVKADGDVLNILSAHRESSQARYFFKAVFDYGEHRSQDWSAENKHRKIDEGIYDEHSDWHVRPDAFSHYRAGFEIRTYRRCERVLMFHHIQGENVLVRSTDFTYTQNDYNDISVLRKVTQRGYRKPKTGDATYYSEEYHLDRGDYVTSEIYAIQSFPPISFKYSAFKPLSQAFKRIEAEGGDMPPQALSNPNYALVDLFGTGLPDVLETSPSGYYYWKNKGEGQLSSRRQLAEMPTNIRLEMPGVGFGDMAGDGQADLLVHQGASWGFYETDGTGGWKKFRSYKQYPSFALNDPSVRLVDMTGDGKSDVLRTDARSFVWFPCEGEEGFGAPKYISRKNDLETFPNVDFSDARVRLADMSGDNLSDIVLVHSGRIDYWANMGNGKFSERITPSNAPRFGANFNPNRLYFADIDGTGTADMIYVDSGKVTIWFNQSGNRWSDGYEINGVIISDLDGIAITDFYGNGTNGILITRNYGLARRNQYSFLDFSGGVKPNLLIEMNNNMGSTTRAQYKPSTYFYRKDYERNYQRAWVSPLPFPVQVLQLVEKIDHISKTRLVTEYCYHHGFYDGKEREFRGFAFVEQKDTEFFDQLQEGEVRNFNKEYQVPSALTKTWFHTGMYETTDLRHTLAGLGVASSKEFDFLDIHGLFRYEYWEGDKNAFDLENSVLHAVAGNIDSKSISEAFRALRGQVLRQEVYGLDDSDNRHIPYTVSESNAKIRLVQPKLDNNHAVYFVHPNESLSYHYERHADDPRLVQELTLTVDESGNVEQSVSIAYPRRRPAFEEQGQLYATLSENKYVHNQKIRGQHDSRYTYFAGVACEKKVYELINLDKVANWQSGEKLQRAALAAILENAEELWYHQTAKDELTFSKRLLSWGQTYFRKIWTENIISFEERPTKASYEETLDVRLGLERINPHGLVFESYQAAFPDQQVKLLLPELSNEDLSAAGYYFYLEHWWIPSGQQSLLRDGYFLPQMTVDAFGNESRIEYDDSEGQKLLMKKAKDALGNKVVVDTNDWVTMQPSHIIDPNGNHSKVAFDALGLVTASAAMERDGDGNLVDGDPLEKFSPLWRYDKRIPYVDDPYGTSNEGRDYLQDATTAMINDLWVTVRKGQTEPPIVFSIAREEHHSKNENPVVQRQLMYFDGLGREVQTKIEATDNPQTWNRRWIGSGWKIYNNKGKVVQQFEPFYTDTAEFEDIYELAVQGEYGVSSTVFYDPLARVVATIHPDGGFEKVEFDTWYQETWDRNDTLNWNPDTEPGIRSWRGVNIGFTTWMERMCIGNAAQQTASQKSQVHAKTPGKTHLDSLGRPFLTVTQNKTQLDGTVEEFETRINLDIQGNDLNITDPRGNKLFFHTFNMLQQQLVINSVDAGEKRVLMCIDEQPYWSIDARGTVVEPKYDALRRSIESWVTPMGNENARFLAMKTTYGQDNNPLAADRNEIGQVIEIQDQAGIVRNTAFEFKGNVKATERQLWSNYKDDIDVSVANTVLSEGRGTYISSSEFDALNRVIVSTAPDGSIFRPQYNKTNQLASLSVELADGSEQQFVEHVDYNARGQRMRMIGGNGVTTTYKYDPDTFRLIKMVSSKNAGQNILQNLQYTYDPVGNITEIKDEAFITIFNCNERIEPKNSYSYDALYRLIKASGRQHVSYNACQQKLPKQTQIIDFGCHAIQGQSNERALTNYTESYRYDKAGNILEIKHVATNAIARNWTRTQTYQEINNQIATTAQNPECYESIAIAHDVNGNIESIPHLQRMTWDFANQMRKVELNTGEDQYAYYVYGSDGMRSRKVIEHSNGIYTQRLYLNGYELYIDGTTAKETLHINDDATRIALVESDDKIRYQMSNHLGSASVETNETGEVLTYEEYTPYGGSAFMACKLDSNNKASEAERKRYRYSGKERDDETGLYYYGARYYAPWMGRWMKADPIGMGDGPNVYQFVKGDPINHVDMDGNKTMVKQNKAAGNAREAFWKDYMKSVSREGIVDQVRYRDPQKLNSKKQPKQGRYGPDNKARQVDIVGLDVDGSGRNIEIEVSSYGEFERSRKQKQLAASRDAIRRGAVVKDRNTGQFHEVHEVFEARALPILGENVPIKSSNSSNPTQKANIVQTTRTTATSSAMISSSRSVVQRSIKSNGKNSVTNASRSKRASRSLVSTGAELLLGEAASNIEVGEEVLEAGEIVLDNLKVTGGGSVVTGLGVYKAMANQGVKQAWKYLSERVVPTIGRALQTSSNALTTPLFIIMPPQDLRDGIHSGPPIS